MKIIGCEPGAAAYGADAPRGNCRSRVSVSGTIARVRSSVGMAAMGLIALTLAACGGGGSSGGGTSSPPPPPPPAQYTIGGSVTGLTGTGLVLQDNGGDNLPVSQNGSFTFATKVNSGAAYSVTVMTQPSGQTCAVSSGSGMASANVTSVAVACTAVSSNVTIGGTVTGLTGTGLVLQDNGTDNLSITSSGPFTFATALASGKAYAVTVATQPTSPSQTCTVANGTGTTGSSNVTNVAITCSAAVGNFAYANDSMGGNVYAYSINASTGGLTQVSVSSGLNAPSVVALAPNGKFAFTSSDNGTKIHAFTIDQTSGKLTEVPGSPFTITGFSVGTQYPDIAVDPQSAHLYIASEGDNAVAAFAIDGSSGALTQIGTYAAGAGADQIPAFSPNGEFLYVMDTTANAVSGYSIDPTSGALTPIPTSPFPTGSQPDWIVFTPDGKYAYVANNGQDTISAYSVDATSGALTPLTTPTYPTDEHPEDLTIDSTGTHLYAPVALGSSNGAIDGFTINADGSLTKITGSGSWLVGITPRYLALDPTAPFAYVSSAGTGGTGVYGFSVDPTTGALTALTGNPFPTGPAGSATAAEPQFITIDPSGKYGYTADQGTGTITGFAIDPTTGALTPLTGSPYVMPGGKPFFVSISPEAPGVRD
jgi:6-phosphogluconolactonase (cycloisomerase 2 family)